MAQRILRILAAAGGASLLAMQRRWLDSCQRSAVMQNLCAGAESMRSAMRSVPLIFSVFWPGFIIYCSRRFGYEYDTVREE